MPPEGPSPHKREEEKIERLQRAMYSRSPLKRMGERPRRELQHEMRPVGEDWVRTEDKRTVAGLFVAPPGMGIIRVLAKWVFIGAVAFFLGAGAFVLYFFTLGGGATASAGNIDISITGPLQVSSGSVAEFQVSVTNRNRADLKLADLIVKYPKGTRSAVDSLTDLPSERYPIGDIPAGARAPGTIRAVFAGNEGDTATITLEVEYRLQDSSAIFVSSAEYEFLFSSSPLSISVEANDEIISGQPVEMTITVASNADGVVRDVLLAATMPFGFNFTDSSLTPLKQTVGLLWAIGDIRPGEKKQVYIRGTLSGEANDERVFRLSAGTRRTAEEQKINATLADHIHRIVVSRPFLDLAVVVNRGESGGAIVAPGDIVPVSVQWANNLSTVLTDVVVVARFSGVDIDGQTVRVTDGFYRSADRAILWDKTTYKSFESIAAGDRGALTFFFTAPSSEQLAALRNPQLVMTVHAAGRRISEQGVPESLQSTASETIRLASDVQILGYGLYHTNPLGSSGPLPPKAGEETTYAVVLSVTNTTNLIRNATVRAIFPPYVRSTGVYSPGSERLELNPNDSSVTWNIGDIAPGTGIGGTPPREVIIAIGMTPSTSQTGQQPALLRNITLRGTDETGNEITRTTPDVTTNLSLDAGFRSNEAAVIRE